MEGRMVLLVDGIMKSRKLRVDLDQTKLSTTPLTREVNGKWEYYTIQYEEREEGMFYTTGEHVYIPHVTKIYKK